MEKLWLYICFENGKEFSQVSVHMWFVPEMLLL